MTSSPTGSHASLYKSAGAVQSPQQRSTDTHSPPSTRDLGALPTPPSLSSKEEPGAHKCFSNGGSAVDASNAQNESEAETEILSDDQREESKPRSAKIKQEQGLDDDVTMPDAHPTAAITVRDRNGKHSSIETDRTRRNVNGDVKKHNGANGRRRRSASESPARSIHSHSSHPQDDNISRGSPLRASTSPMPDAVDRRILSPGSRKRKTREDQLLRTSEPPRQKYKSNKSSNQPLPASHTVQTERSHRRSTSTQSNLPSTQKRTLREPSLNKYSSRDDDSDSDFTSDENDGLENSPYPAVVTFPRPRSKRSSNKPLTSPIRAMPQKRKNPLDKYGASELSKACERGELDEVTQEYELHPELLDLADNAGVTPLAKAALNGHEDIVEYLLGKKCKVNCQTKNRETPLMDAVENGHLPVVRILLAHGANPHHQNEDGHRALDLINDDCDEAADIELELKKAMRDYAGEDTVEPTASQSAAVAQSSARKDLFHVDPSRANLRSYSAKGDALAVSEILVSIKPDLSCVVAAARGGHETVLSLLLASAGDDFKRDPDPAKHEETPLLAAIGRGHFGVLKLLLDQDNFNPTRRTKEGKTYFQVAQDIRGPKWEKEMELLKEYYDAYRSKHPAKGMKKRTSAPSALPASKKSKAQETSLHKREGSSSPRLAHKPPSPDLKRRSKVADDLPKHKGRYITKREISQSREQTQRKRLVVDEDSEEESENEVSRPASREQPLSKKTASEDKPKSLTSNMRRKSSGSTGKPEATERKKGSKQVEEKPMIETKNVTSSKPSQGGSIPAAAAPVIEDPPQPPSRETTPDEVKEARRLAAERLAREAEEKRIAAEEKRIAAEEKRIAAEEKRIAAEKKRIAAEERQKRIAEEEKRIAAERAAREKRLAMLPPTIKRACELGSERPLLRRGRELGVTEVHLPLHIMTLEADPFDPSSNANDRWCMSFQAVGLLGLPEPDLSVSGNWPGRVRPVTAEQRSRFRIGYNLQRLAQDFIFPLPGEEDWDEDRGKKEAEASKEAEERFSTMPLVWVRLEDILRVARESEWLHGVEITTWERSLLEKKGNCGSLRAKLRRDMKEVINGASRPVISGDVEMSNG